MGIYDRDWWRERNNQRSEGKESSWRRPASEQGDAVKRATYNPRAHRVDPPPSKTQPGPQPPDIPGSEWHWTVKLIAFGLVMTLLLVAAKHIGPMLR